jgi:hypothetical protein
MSGLELMRGLYAYNESARPHPRCGFGVMLVILASAGDADMLFALM